MNKQNKNSNQKLNLQDDYGLTPVSSGSPMPSVKPVAQHQSTSTPRRSNLNQKK